VFNQKVSGTAMLMENLKAQKATRYKAYLAKIDNGFAVNELARSISFGYLVMLPSTPNSPTRKWTGGPKIRGLFLFFP
jgi:hypothetical protein